MEAPHEWFLFWQRSDVDQRWRVAPAQDRERIITQRQPAFITALELDADFETELTPEQQAQVHYRGDFYSDLDGPIEDTITDLQKLVGKIEALEINPDQCRFYATGGRGFHLEIPIACFLPTVPRTGFPDLPAIYRKIAERIAVDTLDMAIYSAKRGRLWRCVNVKRANGLYKVPITLAEVQAMTPEMYTQLCSAPREPITPHAPVFSFKAMAAFRDAQDQVRAKASTKGDASALAGTLRQRFAPRGYALPPSLLALAAGKIRPREGAGFNKVALQLCLVAKALGVTQDPLLTLCAGLIEHHQSDGNRYNTPAKRRDELITMFRYVENSDYAVSIGGIRSILPHGLRCDDLRGL